MIPETIDGLKPHLHDDVHRPAGFDEKHEGSRRKGGHHGFDEFRPGQGGIGDRRTIQVPAPGAEIHKVSECSGRGLVANRAVSRDATFNLIPADDLTHFEEDRGVGIPPFDDIQ